MQFTYTAAKGLSSKALKSARRAYMKKQGLEEGEIIEWLEWWERKNSERNKGE